MALWALTIISGWALVHWLHMPDSSTYTAALNPAEHSGFVEALYVSLVNLTTLGAPEVLEAALRDLATILDERFLQTLGSPGQTITADQRDHGQRSGAPG